MHLRYFLQLHKMKGDNLMLHNSIALHVQKSAVFGHDEAPQPQMFLVDPTRRHSMSRGGHRVAQRKGWLEFLDGTVPGK